MIGAAYTETPKLYGYQGERYIEWNKESRISIKNYNSGWKSTSYKYSCAQRKFLARKWGTGEVR